MSRLITSASAVAGLLLMAPIAHAAGSWTIGVHGGVSLPTGDFARADSTGLQAEAGPQAGIEIGYAVNDRITVGIDAAWIRNTHADEGTVEDFGGGVTFTSDKDRFRILRAGLHARFMVPVENRPVHPYGLLGVGVYHLVEDYHYTLAGTGPTVVFTDEGDNVSQPGARLGGKIGLGATWQAAERLGIDLRADFNVLSLDKSQIGLSSATYVGIQAGVSYRPGAY